QRRHPRLPLDPRAARPRPADRLRLPRRAGGRAPSGRGRGARGGARAGLRPGQGGVQAVRLSPASAEQLPPDVARPAYDRDAQAIGIVHFGLGAFHRAHQAWYTDACMNAGERGWAISGVSLRSDAVARQLAPQDGLYTLTERGEDEA